MNISSTSYSYKHQENQVPEEINSELQMLEYIQQPQNVILELQIPCNSSKHLEDKDQLEQVVVNSINATSDEAIRKLKIVSFVCIIFMCGEFISGYIGNSLAILTDATHLFSDLSGFIISIVSIYLGKKQSNQTMSFGYHRAEVIGSMLSILLIWGLTFGLIYEAALRIQQPSDIDARVMLITACIGLVFNIVMGKILHGGGHSHGQSHHQHGHGHQHHGDKHHHDHDHKHLHDNKKQNYKYKKMSSTDKIEEEEKNFKISVNTQSNGILQSQKASNNILENITDSDTKYSEKVYPHKHDKKQHKNKNLIQNINIRSALIHVIGDIIQSIGVVIASIILYIKPEYKLADPLCTVLFSILVFITTIPVIKDVLNILMEGVPSEINLEKLKQQFLDISDVVDVHDLHVWSLSVGKTVLSVNILANHSKQILVQAKQICSQYGILHSTIQIENIDKEHSINCKNNIHK